MNFPILKIVITFFTAGLLYAGLMAAFDYRDDGFDLNKFLLNGLFFGVLMAAYTAFKEWWKAKKSTENK